MACSQTGYDSIPRSAGIPRLHRHRTSERREKREEGVCVCADHAELAPGGANGLELHHDVLVRFGFSGLGVLVRVVVQGLLLVVLVQLLLCGAQKDRKKGSYETEKIKEH